MLLSIAQGLARSIVREDPAAPNAEVRGLENAKRKLTPIPREQGLAAR
jgi:hypothetical protein